jgi:hypothetical protein
MILIFFWLVKTPKKNIFYLLCFFANEFCTEFEYAGMQHKPPIMISTFSNEKYLLNQQISFHIYQQKKLSF